MWSWLLDWLGLTWINLNSWRDSRSHAQNRRSIRGWGGHRNGSTLLQRTSPKVPVRRWKHNPEQNAIPINWVAKSSEGWKVKLTWILTWCWLQDWLGIILKCTCCGDDECQHIHEVSVKKTNRDRKTRRKDATKTQKNETNKLVVSGVVTVEKPVK